MNKIKKLQCVIIILLPLLMQAQGIEWTTGLSWQQVKQKAKAENKYIFIDAYTTWCGPCKDMDKNVYVNDSVGDFFNQHFISVRMQMDKTKNDDKSVKKQYQDVIIINKNYLISGFPSYIFLNPQGTTTDLISGYKNVTEFMNIGRATMQPGRVYDNQVEKYNHLVAEYQKGNTNYNELPFMIKIASRLDTGLRKELMKLHKSYVIKLEAKDRYSKDNIQFWSSLHLGFDSPLFQFFLKDAKAIDKVMARKGYAADVIDKAIKEQIITPFLTEQNTSKEIPMDGMYANGLMPDSSDANWKKLHQIISKQFNNKVAERNVLAARVEWYARHLYYYNYCKYTLAQLEKYAPELSLTGTGDIMTINVAAYCAFQQLTDKSILNEYVRWMGKVVPVVEGKSFGGIYFDTYACLLYKVGKTEEAILWETKAFNCLDGYQEEYREKMEQMRRGEPININQTNWEGINTVNWNGFRYFKFIVLTDATGKPMEGVTILNKRSGEVIKSNQKGTVKMEVSLNDDILVTLPGYDAKEISITKEPGVIRINLKRS